MRDIWWSGPKGYCSFGDWCLSWWLIGKFHRFTILGLSVQWAAQTSPPTPAIDDGTSGGKDER